MTWSTHAVPALFARRQQHAPKSLHRIIDGRKKGTPSSTRARGLLQVVASSL